MTQYQLPDPINPATTSGTQLADILSGTNKWRDALESCHQGNSRPSYAQAGTLWVDDSDPLIPELKMYTGATDTTLARISVAGQNTIEKAQVELGEHLLSKLLAAAAPPAGTPFWWGGVSDPAMYTGAATYVTLIVGKDTTAAPGAYSFDGSSWISVPAGQLGGTAIGNFDAAYSPSLTQYVAVGEQEAISPFENVRYSGNLTAWTQVVAGDATLRGVCWSESLGLYVAVGDVGTGSINSFRSTDGITWTPITAGQTGDAGLYKVVFLDKLARFVAVGDVDSSFNNVFYSDDGISWTAGALPAMNNARGLTKSEKLGRYLAGSNLTTNNVAYSDDGANWTSVTSPLFTATSTFDAMRYVESLNHFVFYGGAAGFILASEDAKNWKLFLNSPFSGATPQVILESKFFKRAIVAGTGGAVAHTF